jgi:hypothetical protein
LQLTSLPTEKCRTLYTIRGKIPFRQRGFFLFTVCNDDLRYSQRSAIGWMRTNQLEGTWKEAAVTLSKILPQHVWRNVGKPRIR